MFIEPDSNTVRLVPFGGDLETILRYMQAHGTMALVAYDAESGRWTCCWITADEQLVSAHAEKPSDAARGCLRKVFARLAIGEEKPP